MIGACLGGSPAASASNGFCELVGCRARGRRLSDGDCDGDGDGDGDGVGAIEAVTEEGRGALKGARWRHGARTAVGQRGGTHQVPVALESYITGRKRCLLPLPRGGWYLSK